MTNTTLNQPLYTKLFNDITDFRMAFGLPIGCLTYDQNSENIHNELYLEELTELATATDKIEQADAIVDSVYVLMGKLVQLEFTSASFLHPNHFIIDHLLTIAERLEINFDGCWDEIHRSNMSKVCETTLIAEATVASYEEKGIKAMYHKQGNFYVVKCAETISIGGTSPKVIKEGKVLKSVNYCEPHLHEVVNL